MLEEVRCLLKDHHVRSLEFEDDNLTLDNNRAVAIFEGLVRLNEEGADISWSAHNGIRIDTLTEETIRLAKESNCQSLNLALEHGDTEMLELMNKRLDLDKAFEVIGWCVEHEIPLINLFVIVGYPGETLARFEKGLDYLRRIRKLGGNVSISTNIAQPYPGTRLLARCIEEGYVGNENTGDFLAHKSMMSTTNSVSIVTPDFDVQEVFRRKAMLEQWSGSSGWKRSLKRVLPAGLISLLNRLRGIERPRRG